MTEMALASAPAIAVPQRPAASVSWHAFDLRTGKRGVRLQTRTLGTVSRIIGEPTELSGLDVLCWDAATERAVPEWDTATLPGRALVVALDELEQPVWAGFVVRRRSSAGQWVALDLVTLEGYFDRRFTSNHLFTSDPQGEIVEAVILGDVVSSGVAFTVDADSDQLRDRQYYADEDKTVLSVLQELMDVEGGPEFTVDLAWVDDSKMALNMIVRVRDRIGGSAAAARFTMPGSVVGFDYVEDYTADAGANYVVAVSSGEGDARPSAGRLMPGLISSGWAVFEHRFTPSTSIINPNVLAGHAQATLAQMQDGLRELTLEAHLDQAPRVGQDVWLGDDVTVELTCPRFPLRIGLDGEVQAGYEQTVRMIGYELDFDERRFRPRLLEVG